MIFLTASLLVTSIVLTQTGSVPSVQDCIKAGREHTTKRQKEARPLTSDIIRAIDAERAAMLRECVAGFDVQKTEGRPLVDLLEAYIEAAQPQLVERALARGLDSTTLSELDRADMLVLAVRYLLRQQPKSAERNARAERYVDMLDRLPDEAIERKLAAHGSLNSYYRGDDIDAGIIKHSTWIIEAAPRLTPEQRKKFASQLINAYNNLAEAVAGQGETGRAIELLKRAPADLTDLPDVEKRTKPTLARYLLVGTPGAPITAPVWLTAPPGTQSMEMKGQVTLLEFTAHWCGPCKESYPGVQRLRQRFGSRGFRVVFATQLFGYFERERDLTAEQEIERDRTYFAGLGFDIPIAIGPRGDSMVNGQRVFTKDPNNAAYEVGGIPQIQILDRQGNIRLMMVGYDDANEEKLAALIEKLLKETVP